MKSREFVLFALTLWVITLIPASTSAQEVKIEGGSFQAVLDKMFGTPAAPGLFADGERFDLRAKDVTLTAEQADLFFVPSSTSTTDFADLISAAEQVKGNLKIQGLLDGDAFELNLSGKQVKAEGLVLTQAEFDALVAELKQIPSLKEAKISAIVDGQLLVAKLENQAGRVKIENKELRGRPDDGEAGRRGPNSGKNDLPREASNREDRRGPNGRPEKPEKPEKIERVGKIERVERLEKIERIERPDLDHGGPGRR